MKTIMIDADVYVRTVSLLGTNWYAGRDVLDMAGVPLNRGKPAYERVKPGDHRCIPVRPGSGNSHKFVNRNGLIAMVEATPWGRRPGQMERLIRRLDGLPDPEGCTPGDMAFEQRRKTLVTRIQSAATIDDLKDILVNFCQAS